MDCTMRKPYPTDLTDTQWGLVEAFLDGMKALVEVARNEDLGRVLYPATLTEPGWTVGYKLSPSVAKHNAYHLGQIALLRKLLS